MRLVLSAHKGEPIERSLEEGGKLILGRSGKRSDVTFKDDRLSRAHCVIWGTGEGGLFLADLNSSNGTFLNGQEVKETRPLARQGDRIEIGETVVDVAWSS